MKQMAYIEESQINWDQNKPFGSLIYKQANELFKGVPHNYNKCNPG